MSFSQPINFGSIESLLAISNPITARYPLEFADGTITELLYNDPEHTYYVQRDGDMVPVVSVTTITGSWDKPALPQWAANETCDALRLTMPRFYGETADEKFIPQMVWDEFEDLLENARFNYKEISKNALDVGDEAHAFIELWLKELIKGNDPTHLIKSIRARIKKVVPRDAENCFEKRQQVFNCIRGAIEWLRDHNFRPIKAEFKLYSRLYNFAGTTDAKGYIDSCHNPECTMCAQKSFQNILVIADWKSSRGLYDEYILQTAAYAEADAEMTGQPVEARVIVVLGKYDGTVRGFMFSAADQADDFGAFLGIMTAFERFQAIEERNKSEKARQRAEAKAIREKAKANAAAEKVAAKELKLWERQQAKAAKEAAKAKEKADKAAARAAKKAAQQIERAKKRNSKQETVTIQ